MTCIIHLNVYIVNYYVHMMRKQSKTQIRWRFDELEKMVIIVVLLKKQEQQQRQQKTSILFKLQGFSQSISPVLWFN